MQFEAQHLVFNTYPNRDSWGQFFIKHHVFWLFVTTNARSLFPVSLSYPFSSSGQEQSFSDYQKKGGLRTLEDFFALYFFLIIYLDSEKKEKNTTSFRDQEIWKSLWERECWSNRAKQEDLINSIQKLKKELSALGSNQYEAST